MTTLNPNQLVISRCPHCQVDTPSMQCLWNTETQNYVGQVKRSWCVYKCSRCGGLVTASAAGLNYELRECYPSSLSIDEAIPARAKDFLSQALNSLHAPSGAIMLSASSVDAMLKDKGYKEGSLYSRIKKAAEDHLITDDMAKWAHQVRLDANDQRHDDEDTTLPDEEDAKKSVDFAMALAEFLFVLPSKVTRGLEETSETSS